MRCRVALAGCVLAACRAASAPAAGSGRISVSPTSKEQCKNNGWRDFGRTFTNQGQGVAFVQRGPKPSTP